MVVGASQKIKPQHKGKTNKDKRNDLSFVVVVVVVVVERTTRTNENGTFKVV